MGIGGTCRKVKRERAEEEDDDKNPALKKTVERENIEKESVKISNFTGWWGLIIFIFVLRL